MPGDRNGNRGGKREKRRVRQIARNLESEDWTLASVRPSKSTRCYKFVVHPAESAVPSTSSSSVAPSVAPHLLPVPVEQLALSTTPIAVDFHNVLDGGSVDGFIPTEHVLAYSRLIAAGFVPWILSYIGNSGPASQTRRFALERARRYLAKQLGYPTECPLEPTVGKVFAYICERKLYNARFQSGGKAEQLLHFSTEIIVDDNASICDEAASWGFVTYQVKHQNFCGAVDNIIEDNRSGILDDKLRIARESQQK